MSKAIGCIMMVLLVMAAGCKKSSPPLRYFEIGLNNNSPEWQDTSFVVATSNPQLLSEVEAQLQLPVAQRTKIVSGALLAGSGGYNKNASHSFLWHFNENDWHLTDLSIELSDGRPYSDVDMNLDYWLHSVKRFSPWSSYIKKEIYPDK